MNQIEELIELYLDGVGEGEGDDIAGIDAGGEEVSGGVIDELIEACMGEIEVGGDAEGAAGRELSGDVGEQGGEGGDRHW